MMQEKSAGKDTMTGHWEIMGLILITRWVFPDGFPQELIRKIEAFSGRKVIGNKAASGTKIIKNRGRATENRGVNCLYFR